MQEVVNEAIRILLSTCSLFGGSIPHRLLQRTPELIAEVAMPSLQSGFTSLESRNTHAGLPMD